MSFGDLSGHHSVGFVDEFLDSGLCFRLFYPSSGHEDSRSLRTTPWIISSNYLQSLVSFGLGRDLSSFVCSLIHWIIRYPHLSISKEASPKAGPFPLVLFSHGLGGSRMAYSKLATHIASHGFVVASLEHLDGSASLAHQAPDKWIPYQPPEDVRKALSFRSSQIDTRIQELKHVYEFLKDNKPFADVNQTILCGHSFGAATILALLKAEPSLFMGGVAYDVYIDPLSEKPDVMSQAPFLAQKILFINNELFIKKVNQELLNPFEQGHHNIWTIKGTLHYCQSDVPTVVKNARFLPYFIGGRMDLERDQVGFDFSVQAFVHYVQSKLLKENPTSFDEFIEEKKEILVEGF